MPWTIPPDASITGPDTFINIKSPEGPRCFITPRTSTLKESILSPCTTVSAWPTMPRCKSSTFINSIAWALVKAAPHNKSASTPLVHRRQKRCNCIYIASSY